MRVAEVLHLVRILRSNGFVLFDASIAQCRDSADAQL
jgi:hypothetical protein